MVTSQVVWPPNANQLPCHNASADFHESISHKFLLLKKVRAPVSCAMQRILVVSIFRKNGDLPSRVTSKCEATSTSEGSADFHESIFHQFLLPKKVTATVSCAIQCILVVSILRKNGDFPNHVTSKCESTSTSEGVCRLPREHFPSISPTQEG